VADLAGGDHVGAVLHQRDEAGPHRFHEKGVVAPGCGGHAGDFRGIECHGLFTKHGFALLQTDQRVFFMEAMRSGDIDCVDGGICGQLFITVVGLFGAVSGGETPGAVGIAGCNGMKPGIARQREGGGELGSYLSGADDAPGILFTYGW
jgi:hypothetical protein